MQSAETSPLISQPSWRESLLAPRVWRSATYYGLPAGLIQAALNQGDHWLTGQVTTAVVVKSVISPLVGFGVAFIAAFTTHRESSRRLSMPDELSVMTPQKYHGLS
jgi:phosphate/sulfate permease